MKGRLSQLVDQKIADEESFARLYLVALSRRPTEQEIKHCRSHLRAAKNRRHGLEDVLWALINGREFTFNH